MLEWGLEFKNKHWIEYWSTVQILYSCFYFFTFIVLRSWIRDSVIHYFCSLRPFVKRANRHRKLARCLNFAFRLSKCGWTATWNSGLLSSTCAGTLDFSNHVPAVALVRPVKENLDSIAEIIFGRFVRRCFTHPFGKKAQSVYDFLRSISFLPCGEITFLERFWSSCRSRHIWMILRGPTLHTEC